MNKKLWGGRFTAETESIVDEYTASIYFDKELALEDMLGSMAHANMLCHCGIINADENAKIQAGLRELAEKHAAGELQFNLADEDIHMNIERMLFNLIGDPASKLHTARSRNDQVALDLHLYLRKQILDIVELITILQITLLTLAKKHSTTIVPGYTHLQRAQPVYLGQYFCAYAAMFTRDVTRLKNCWHAVNHSPLGAGALAGTSFPTDRDYTANLLGFDGVHLNTLDAVSNRDFIVEFLSASSLIMAHFSKLSEELILWSSQEFHFIQFADQYCTGSSIMPQKKNPDIAEVARGKTGRVYGALFNLLTVLKGLPLAYNKDLQEDKEPLFDTIKTVKQTLKIYSPLLASMTVNEDTMYQATQSGYLNATILAEYLVKHGLSFRAAHESVGKIVGFCIAQNKKIEDLSLSELQQFASIIRDDVYQSITVENAAAATNASTLAKELLAHQNALQENLMWLNDKKALINSVYQQLMESKEVKSSTS